MSSWKRDRAAVAAITSLWEYDPDPAATLAIQAEINAALARGDIEYARDRDGQLKGNYFCCPWSAVYRVINPLAIGGTWLRRNQEFTFDVSAEEMGEGGEFKREILKGNFSPTDRVDYCDPESGGHHDD